MKKENMNNTLKKYRELLFQVECDISMLEINKHRNKKEDEELELLKAKKQDLKYKIANAILKTREIEKEKDNNDKRKRR